MYIIRYNYCKGKHMFSCTICRSVSISLCPVELALLFYADLQNHRNNINLTRQKGEKENKTEKQRRFYQSVSVLFLRFILRSATYSTSGVLLCVLRFTLHSAFYSASYVLPCALRFTLPFALRSAFYSSFCVLHCALRLTLRFVLYSAFRALLTFCVLP